MPSNTPSDMATAHREKLLSHKNYDTDALLGTFDELVESGSDDDFGGSQSVLEVHETDRAILKEEEDREKLLARPSRLDKIRQALVPKDGSGEPGTRRQKRRKRRERRKAERRERGKNVEDAELMFEMEGGFKDTSSGSSTDSETSRVKWAANKKGVRPFNRSCT